MAKKIKGLGIALVFALSLGGYAPVALAQPFGLGNIVAQIRQEARNQLSDEQQMNRGMVIKAFVHEFARTHKKIGRIISKFVRGIIATPSI